MARRNHPKKVTRPKIETLLGRYLADLQLPFKSNHYIGRYNVDFLVNNKYIIECYGDFFHCNPKKYPADYFNRVLKCEAQARWTRDNAREAELRSMGYRFLSLWETDIAFREKWCKSQIRQLLMRD